MFFQMDGAGKRQDIRPRIRKRIPAVSKYIEVVGARLGTLNHFASIAFRCVAMAEGLLSRIVYLLYHIDLSTYTSITIILIGTTDANT